MTESRAPSTRNVLLATTRHRVAELQARFLRDDASTVATLARLRRCDPAAVGADPTVWDVTLGDLPDELTASHGRRSDDPTPAERALHATLVLYALHQQSGDQGVHRPHSSLGAATAQVARARAREDEQLDGSTVGRLHQAGLATTFEGHVHHLRGLVQLMRAESPPVALDYGLLAVDLWQLADPQQDSSYVLARWGRDLHARPKQADAATPDTTSTTEEIQK